MEWHRPLIGVSTIFPASVCPIIEAQAMNNLKLVDGIGVFCSYGHKLFNGGSAMLV